MRIKKKKISKYCIKFSVEDEGKEAGKAYLYILSNDAHKDPFGIVTEISLQLKAIEDDTGERLLEEIKDMARESECYRLTVISENYKRAVNKQLKRSGFGEHGKEYRLDM